MTPFEASKKKNESLVYLNLYPNGTAVAGGHPKFKIEDKLRISKYKRKVFDKGYSPNWTEIFIVDDIKHSSPVTYKLKDLAGEEINSSFYEQEMLKAEMHEDSLFRTEKVIRRDNKRGGAIVKWSGYPHKFNSYVDLKDLKNTTI